ncbi:PD-(D/E)XK nuclease family protein, partial [Ideonella livida]
LAGNFLHDQLEWLAGEGFALDDAPQAAPDRADPPPGAASGDPTPSALARRLLARCERAGRGDAQAAAVLAWLRRVLVQPLAGPLGQGPDTTLTVLGQRGAVLAEMEFWLPVAHLDAPQVDALCRQHLWPGRPALERPALGARTLHGLMMGFADLVFEHEGRWWVLDYKSNQLGSGPAAYTDDALAAAMGQHRYDVQAALYLLALHRLLRQRLGAAYRPQAQLGGAVYLFLRGLDGPSGGVCVLPPSLPLLEALERAFDVPPASSPDPLAAAPAAAPDTFLPDR